MLFVWFVRFKSANSFVIFSPEANVTVSELEQYIKEEQFAPGSMLPKIEAAIEFVNNTKDGQAIITSLENISQALDGDGGTIVSL